MTKKRTSTSTSASGVTQSSGADTLVAGERSAADIRHATKVAQPTTSDGKAELAATGRISTGIAHPVSDQPGTDMAGKAGAQHVGANPESRFMDDPLWFKDAVIYQIHVKSYFDSNNDGIGDFAGLISKLDHIADLGVNTIWLLPFYPSPRRDDGYDIAQYKGVHEDYGDMADVRRFIKEAHRRGLRVVTELVINHTSDQHPWFQRARHAKKGSAARNFYVWSDSNEGYEGTRIIFLDTEKSNWTWDPVAGQYFWHRFFSHQPDLNFDNPQVLKAVTDVMTYWLDMGVDGLRLDAVPYLIEREGTSNENLPETHHILKVLRKHMDDHYPGRMLLAEANMWPEDVQQYFGDEDECHMAFHFPLMPRMYMALAQQDRFPMTDILRQTPDIPATCQWAIFLRNHDELTLEMVTDRERDYLWRFYSPDRRARINLGIRRRLAPLVERDRRRIELLNSFLLSMPGTPVIYYGDEIGMGDNIHLNDRDGVRTPMQWTPDRNGGFSRVDPARLVLPTIMDAQYGYEAVNVEAQSGDPYSLLNWTKRMLAVRKQHRAFGRGRLTLMYPANRKIFAYTREFDDSAAGGTQETILCVANVSQSAQPVELDLSQYAGRVPVEMLGGTAFAPVTAAPYTLTLPPFGFLWFVLANQAHMPAWFAPPSEMLPDYITLVFRHHIEEMLQDPVRSEMERDVLPLYLTKRRWFVKHQSKPPEVRILSISQLPKVAALPQAFPVLIALAEVRSRGPRGPLVEHYHLPLGFILEQNTITTQPMQLALSRARRGRDVGLLTDAFSLDSLGMGVLEQLRVGSDIDTGGGTMHFRAEPGFAAIDLATEPGMRRIATDQSNSSVVIDEKVVLKIIRRVESGMHPEAEMGRYLTGQGYANVPEFLGEVTLSAGQLINGAVADNGPKNTEQAEPTSLLLLHKFIHNQSDAWQWASHTLERQIMRAIVIDSDQAEARIAEDESELLIELTDFAAVLGRRLAEMHAVLARPTDHPAFAPEASDEGTVTAWRSRTLDQISMALDALEPVLARADATPADHQLIADAKALLALREPLAKLVANLCEGRTGVLLTRLHGNLHLGQILMVQNDAYFIDFEGESSLTLEQRREKSSPWQDVAGLLRSFDYLAAYAHNVGASDLGHSGDMRKRTFLQKFSPACQESFLSAYIESRRQLSQNVAGVVSGLDQDDADDMALLDLFTLDKAAYEICFDATNRPGWLPVPVKGMLKIAQRLLNPAAEGNLSTHSPSDLLRSVLNGVDTAHAAISTAQSQRARHTAQLSGDDVAQASIGARNTALPEGRDPVSERDEPDSKPKPKKS